ncbi:MAG TPA: putative Ig domain-containing protein [Dongiaceae bacterium]|nr:putative Ig domain-containing protein [Dongiaceae bacterium]
MIPRSLLGKKKGWLVRRLLLSIWLLAIGLAVSIETGCVGLSKTSPDVTPALSISANLPGASLGVAYNGSISVSGGNSPYAYAISSGTLPSGLAINSTSGTITGTPSSSGTSNFTVTVTDSAKNQAVSGQLSIAVADIKISVSPTSATVASRGTLQFTATLTGISNTSITWTASSGTISSSGLYTAPIVSANTTATVTATSVADASKQASATLTITPAGSANLSVTTTNLATATQGTAYNQSLTATGGTPPYTYAITSGALPSGLALKATSGAITGTPSSSGTFSFTVTVTDSAKNQAVSGLLSITVVDIKISVSPSSATVASQGTLQFTATLTGISNTSVTWTASSGTISSSGLYTAPLVSVNTTATVSATSVADASKQASATLTITPLASSNLTITTTSLATATQGTAYNQSLTATGGTAPYSWSISSGALAGGLTLSSAGSLSGTPTQSGQFSFTAQVKDTSSPQLSASKSFALTVNSLPTGNSISSSFFNIHVNQPTSPWPSSPVAGQRLWDAAVQWALINTASGVYDWSDLDSRLSEAKTHGADVLFDLARTPAWAQCNTTTASACVQTPGCAYESSTWGGGPGQCYWPEDLNADGTGSNQHWKDWVTAIATHSVNNGPSYARIKYYEIWNEPNQDVYWRGTVAQLVRMTNDAACIIKGVGTGCNNTNPIDPTAMIVTPAPTNGGAQINTFLDAFFSGGGADTVDVIAFHGYNGADPEAVDDTISVVQSGPIVTYALTSKPLFDTEYSWGLNTPFADPDQQAGFVARGVLLHVSRGVDKLYWYAWETSGVMWSANAVAGCTTPDASGVGFTCLTGLAYTQVQNWTVGASISQPCAANGTVYTCGFTKANGYKSLAVWDAAQSCSNGVCTTSQFTVPGGYVHSRDLRGNVTSISTKSIAVGYKPVLLENQ